MAGALSLLNAKLDEDKAMADKQYLFVGGDLDGRTIRVDETHNDIYREVLPQPKSVVFENRQVTNEAVSYTVQHYRKCFKFDGVKRTDYFELVT